MLHSLTILSLLQALDDAGCCHSFFSLTFSLFIVGGRPESSPRTTVNAAHGLYGNIYASPVLRSILGWFYRTYPKGGRHLRWGNPLRLLRPCSRGELLSLPVHLITALVSKTLSHSKAASQSNILQQHVFATETSRHLAQAGEQRLSLSRFSVETQSAE